MQVLAVVRDALSYILTSVRSDLIWCRFDFRRFVVLWTERKTWGSSLDRDRWWRESSYRGLGHKSTNFNRDPGGTSPASRESKAPRRRHPGHIDISGGQSAKTSTQAKECNQERARLLRPGPLEKAHATCLAQTYKRPPRAAAGMILKP